MIEESLRKRDFEDEDLRKMLDKASVSDIIGMLGAPRWVKHVFQSTTHWRPGDESPALASDDPAVMQGIGRCAASRVNEVSGIRTRFSIHDADRCEWCDYPLDEMMRACEWAQYQAAYVEAELAIWYEDQERMRGSRYTRQVRGDYYSNIRYADFFASGVEDREAQIARGLYGDAS